MRIIYLNKECTLCHSMIETDRIDICPLCHHDNNRDRDDKSKIVLYILTTTLGMIGAHRFYLRQYRTGLAYFVLGLIFSPMTFVLSMIDLVRYACMSKDKMSHLLLQDN